MYYIIGACDGFFNRHKVSVQALLLLAGLQSRVILKDIFSMRPDLHSGAELVQQMVQIVASFCSHDLTLFLRCEHV